MCMHMKESCQSRGIWITYLIQCLYMQNSSHPILSPPVRSSFTQSFSKSSICGLRYSCLRSLKRPRALGRIGLGAKGHSPDPRQRQRPQKLASSTTTISLITSYISESKLSKRHTRFNRARRKMKGSSIGVAFW